MPLQVQNSRGAAVPPMSLSHQVCWVYISSSVPQFPTSWPPPFPDQTPTSFLASPQCLGFPTCWVGQVPCPHHVFQAAAHCLPPPHTHHPHGNRPHCHTASLLPSRYTLPPRGWSAGGAPSEGSQAKLFQSSYRALCPWHRALPTWHQALSALHRAFSSCMVPFQRLLLCTAFYCCLAGRETWPPEGRNVTISIFPLRRVCSTVQPLGHGDLSSASLGQ